MDTNNITVPKEFILLGFSNSPMINFSLFSFFLAIYLITFVGNGLIMCIVIFSSHLHTPMYFFLCLLSILDLSYSSTAVPKFLSNLLLDRQSISVLGCAMQLYIYIYILLGGTECLLLALMAYDRYIAICRPLHYPILMRWSICHRLTVLAFIASFTIYVLPSIIIPLRLCDKNQVNHFMCEVLAVIKLSCGNIDLSEYFIFFTSFISLLLPFVFIIVSYMCIIVSILKINSKIRFKSFSTCTSHISVVALFYGTGMIMYFGPSSRYSSNQEKYVSTFYVVVSPMLNPLIYSLNNRDVKVTFKNMAKRIAAY